MMGHGGSWQGALAHAGLHEFAFVLAMILSLASGYFNWWIAFTCLCLIAGFVAVVRQIPTLLNLSRSYFQLIVCNFMVFILGVIFSFGLHHKAAGILGKEGKFEPGFWDAIYFSVTTFTTLGYGDFQPVPEMRLATSIQAVAGMFSVALAASVIFLWCQDHLIDKELALFDGWRRRKNSTSISRVRVRTLTGKERELRDWVLPPEEGESLYYDRSRGEWLTVTPDTVLPENAMVIGFRRNADD